jgi:siroheme synthase
MGVRNLGRIASRLIEHGRDPGTPAALIQMACWPDKRVLVTTLASIAEEAERTQVQVPATLVIGEVVKRRDKLRMK